MQLFYRAAARAATGQPPITPPHGYPLLPLTQMQSAMPQLCLARNLGIRSHSLMTKIQPWCQRYFSFSRIYSHHSMPQAAGAAIQSLAEHQVTRVGGHPGAGHE
jgi:hypothetical protein